MKDVQILQLNLKAKQIKSLQNFEDLKINKFCLRYSVFDHIQKRILVTSKLLANQK